MIKLKVVLGAAIFAAMSLAQAAPSYTSEFVFADATNTYTGDIFLTTATPVDSIGELVISATGTVDGSAVTLDTSGYADEDDVLYASPVFFDVAGISLDLANGTQVNIYGDGGSIYYTDDALGTYEGDGVTLNNVSFTPAQENVPEPSSVALLGLGMLALFAAVNRKRQF